MLLRVPKLQLARLLCRQPPGKSSHRNPAHALRGHAPLAMAAPDGPVTVLLSACAFEKASRSILSHLPTPGTAWCTMGLLVCSNDRSREYSSVDHTIMLVRASTPSCRQCYRKLIRRFLAAPSLHTSLYPEDPRDQCRFGVGTVPENTPSTPSTLNSPLAASSHPPHGDQIDPSHPQLLPLWNIRKVYLPLFPKTLNAIVRTKLLRTVYVPLYVVQKA